MPTIHGIQYPDIITGKTPGASLLHIFSETGECISKTYHVCQFNFLTGRAVVALKDSNGKTIFDNGKLVFKTLVIKNPKFSVHGQKPVPALYGKRS